MICDPRPHHEQIRRWFDAAIEVVEPRRAVIDALDGLALLDKLEDRLVVISIGKAAGSMARGARDVLGDRIDRGIILTKYGHLAESVDGFDAYEASHPVPDQNGLAATRAILDVVDGLTERDLVLALISGGGSALLELPHEDISLEEMQSLTTQLMHAGAGIHDLNTVRKALSQVKGGGLRRAIGPARCVSLLLSDVLGNDPSVIASGPTVISSSGPRDAQSVLDRFGLLANLPESIRRTLDRETGGKEDVAVTADKVSVIADNETFVREISRLAEADGLRVMRNPEPYAGDAAALGRDLVEAARGADADVDVIVRGGEATVEVTGNGIGGRNTEMALSAALALDSQSGWVIASLASDGDDGNSGAAGAIADASTVGRARDEGIDPMNALRNNDSASVFRSTGGLVVTGPTGTNVNDVYIALRCRERKVTS
jgi:hydroxypyruvate reductase